MQSRDAQARDEDGDPIYRKNPHPKQAYRITMMIENAPGPFGFVDGATFYQMSDHQQCTPIEPIAGVWSKQKEDSVPAVFKKIDETTYVATIFADGMIDADYYGKGVCHWELTGVGMSLKATGKHEETDFAPSLEKEQVLQSASKKTYFWRGGYPKSGIEDFPDTGKPSAENYAEPNRRNLFVVTLKAEKVSP
ncbi:hypothetical protein Xkhy_18120 [Xanthomonas axonopodis pv. khayae]|uniref:hypothetical protein n=1 Tax=Xanthomonas TaxID=338 RepID=UPI0004E60680|nr:MULTISPECIES: hypothetical protein [Xanthomonas]OOW97916.1 hypothetical protein Xvtr_00270 [Xanthomonas campestris pv. vitiscarnosae]OOW70198.1 hypothetical protein Xmar_02805 [Xanthomonas axonopodis pv. martyniicola]OOX11240.1 hypothetical protein Xkhy_18120 [Xanthomonas axonopodis pv. khayae]PNV30104.1 hypothetical protein xavtCFBP7764_06210 [Xanthomonas citri]WPM78834.1 hypothetical protein XVT_16020 [Xanthomonas citri pv. viticola]